ncbi:MAG: hypothetical protein M1484_01025 [Patescibacteria group bacterium]|nr:hypothetical protein [Patescibacteria group bacterium]MCL5431662.1 hypothetical protein [Patescibacteria group bacterium]
MAITYEALVSREGRRAPIKNPITTPLDQWMMEQENGFTTADLLKKYNELRQSENHYFPLIEETPEDVAKDLVRSGWLDYEWGRFRRGRDVIRSQ